MIKTALYYFLLLILALNIGCKKDSNTKEVALDQKVVDNQPKVESMVCFAAIDRLRIRTDSTLTSGTLVTISEGDELEYLDDYSQNREILQLRGKYFYDPWVKVKHVESGKQGWTYGGALRFESEKILNTIRSSHPIYREIHADDIEWDGTVPTSWQTATIADPTSFKLFMLKFKEMVAKNDIAGISGLIRYPIRNLENRAEFKSQFYNIFNDEMREAVSAQRLDQIFRNSKGASIGNGHVWFQQVGQKYKITELSFKGREDIIRDLMEGLSKTYIAQSGANTMKIQALKIREFLELTLDVEGASDFPRRINLGRFSFSDSASGQHTFYQDTPDSLKRVAIFRTDSVRTDLQVRGGNPDLGTILFEH